LASGVDPTDPEAIAANIGAITICEIKSTSGTSLRADLKGYLFNVTAAES
jgi:hypothetical protein